MGLSVILGITLESQYFCILLALRHRNSIHNWKLGLVLLHLNEDDSSFGNEEGSFEAQDDPALKDKAQVQTANDGMQGCLESLQEK